MNIELTQEQMDICNASPLEAIGYYIAYPQQLIKDASEQGRGVMEYFIDIYKKAEEYISNKN